MQDIGGIRNFVKYVYDNASTPSKKLKYLCLFGDASFDYKDRISNNTNIVPSWYSTESFSLITSFISDDYFGMMDSNEGTMSNNNILDIAVGRILARKHPTCQRNGGQGRILLHARNLWELAE